MRSGSDDILNNIVLTIEKIKTRSAFYNMQINLKISFAIYLSRNYSSSRYFCIQTNTF